MVAIDALVFVLIWRLLALTHWVMNHQPHTDELTAPTFRLPIRTVSTRSSYCYSPLPGYGGAPEYDFVYPDLQHQPVSTQLRLPLELRLNATVATANCLLPK